MHADMTPITKQFSKIALNKSFKDYKVLLELSLKKKEKEKKTNKFSAHPGFL